MSTKYISIAALMTVTFSFQSGFTQGWQFWGPDSTQWRTIFQIDGVFRAKSPPRIAIATSKGMATNFGNRWEYPLRNYAKGTDCFPFSCYSSINYREVYFSPWNDSVAFINAGGISGEASYAGLLRIKDVLDDSTWKSSRFVLECLFCRPMIAFAPHDTGKVYALMQELSKSFDNGLTWIRENALRCPLSFCSNAFRDSVLYHLRCSETQDSLIIKLSKDDGATWHSILTLPYRVDMINTKMLALGDTLLVWTRRLNNTAGNECGIYRSFDQGMTWMQVLFAVNVYAVNYDKQRPEEMYAATSTGIYRSLNAGANWQLFNNTLPTSQLWNILKDPYSDTLYVVSDMGVYKVFGQIVSVKENASRHMPSQFFLLQNFPNPFNPATTIEYSILKRAAVTLRVYDVLGKLMITLVDEIQEPGVYRVIFDGSSLASGTYYYTMKAGTFSETKQMILSK